MFVRYRISVDNAFRNEFAFIDYRRWGVLQVWSAGKFRGPPPPFQARDACISVYFNYELVREVRSNVEGNRVIQRLLSEAPVDLDEFAYYLEL